MRRPILTAALLFYIAFVSAQSKYGKETFVGRIKLPSGLKAQMTYQIYPINDTAYYFTFRDYVHKKAEVFKTIRLSRAKERDALYELLKSAFSKGKARIVYIGANEVEMKRVRSAGSVKAKLIFGNAWIQLTEEEIDTVFGRISFN